MKILLALLLLAVATGSSNQKLDLGQVEIDGMIQVACKDAGDKATIVGRDYLTSGDGDRLYLRCDGGLYIATWRQIIR